MIPRYRLTETAQRHIDEIAAFIAADSMDAALKVLDALEVAFDQIAEMPEIGSHPRRSHAPTAEVLARLFIPRGLRAHERPVDGGGGAAWRQGRPADSGEHLD